MSGKQQPVFVLGMPQCRLAWLSVCLSSMGCIIPHQGMLEHSDFVSWADEIDGYLKHVRAGDCDALLAGWLPEILERWPAARFIVITRENDECLDALLTSTVLHDRRKLLRARWARFVPIFKAACDRLRREERDYRFWNYHSLSQRAALMDLAEFGAGYRPSMQWVQRVQQLYVQSLEVSSGFLGDETQASGQPGVAAVPAGNFGRIGGACAR